MRITITLLAVMALVGCFLVAFGNGQTADKKYVLDMEAVVFVGRDDGWLEMKKEKAGTTFYIPKKAVGSVSIFDPDSEYSTIVYGANGWLVVLATTSKDKWHTQFKTEDEARAFVEFLLSAGEKNDGER